MIQTVSDFRSFRLLRAVALCGATLTTGCASIAEENALATDGWRRASVKQVGPKESASGNHWVPRWFPRCSDIPTEVAPANRYAVVQLYAKPHFEYIVPVDARSAAVKAGDTVWVNVKRCEGAILPVEAADERRRSTP